MHALCDTDSAARPGSPVFVAPPSDNEVLKAALAAKGALGTTLRPGSSGAQALAGAGEGEEPAGDADRPSSMC